MSTSSGSSSPKSDQSQRLDRDARVAMKPPQPRPDFDVQEQILAQHHGVYFINKPAGWPTSGRNLDDPECVQYRLMEHTHKKIWAVHQLDADTSGLNIFTHRKSSVHYWQKRLHYPSAQKEYVALVHGAINRFHKLTDPIGRRPDGSWGVWSKGKRALTHVIPVVTTDKASLVRVQLRTGRTHQIRVHLDALGHPLIGEFWYRDAPCLLADRHMLHAWRTTFDARDDVECAIVRPPQDFFDTAQKLGIEIPDQIDGESAKAQLLRLRKQGDAR